MIVLNEVNPPLEDVLEHFGVKGMRWGVRKTTSSTGKSNRQLNRESRQRDRASGKAARAAENRQRDREIDAARQRVNSGKTQRDFKAAKKQFKLDKKELGTREARKKLNEARAKRMTDFEKAESYKSGSETTAAVLGTVGGTLLGVAIPAALASAGR